MCEILNNVKTKLIACVKTNNVWKKTNKTLFEKIKKYNVNKNYCLKI